ncbi:hypothetical protein [Nonlabens xiamenensis]|uniref:hypothetical protein n=1 Tax=Nonlabens xiamenensis TaxID=2341043 RepID=UPI000F60F53A|nr:hypothetical protein [Nonlabens xiamenensis]
MNRESRIIFFSKPTLNINEIGPGRFWWGIFLGIVLTILIRCSVPLMLELFYELQPLYIRSTQDFSLNSEFRSRFLMALFSTSIGFVFCFLCWMTGTLHTAKIRRFELWKVYYQALFVLALIPFVILKMGSSLILADLSKLSQLLWHSYGWMLLVLPIFIFLYPWVHARRIYRTHRIFWVTFITSISGSFLISEIPYWISTW